MEIEDNTVFINSFDKSVKQKLKKEIRRHKRKPSNPIQTLEIDCKSVRTEEFDNLSSFLSKKAHRIPNFLLKQPNLLSTTRRRAILLFLRSSSSYLRSFTCKTSCNLFNDSLKVLKRSNIVELSLGRLKRSNKQTLMNLKTIFSFQSLKKVSFDRLSFKDLLKILGKSPRKEDIQKLHKVNLAIGRVTKNIFDYLHDSNEIYLQPIIPNLYYEQCVIRCVLSCLEKCGSKAKYKSISSYVKYDHRYEFLPKLLPYQYSCQKISVMVNDETTYQVSTFSVRENSSLMDVWAELGFVKESRFNKQLGFRFPGSNHILDERLSLAEHGIHRYSLPLLLYGDCSR